jgi:hypothetical protein
MKLGETQVEIKAGVSNLELRSKPDNAPKPMSKQFGHQFQVKRSTAVTEHSERGGRCEMLPMSRP